MREKYFWREKSCWEWKNTLEADEITEMGKYQVENGKLIETKNQF